MENDKKNGVRHCKFCTAKKKKRVPIMVVLMNEEDPFNN